MTKPGFGSPRGHHLSRASVSGSRSRIALASLHHEIGFATYEDAGFWVTVLGYRVQGSGFGVQGFKV